MVGFGGGSVRAYKVTIEAQLKTYVTGLRGSMKTLVGEWATFADVCLTAVETQLTKLIGFIDSFYSDLVEVAHFNPRSAWVLVGRCVGAFFEAQRNLRAEAALLEGVSTLENKALMILTVLQCHEKVQEFVTANWRSHPTIVKEIGLFMLTERVDSSQLKTLEAKLSSFEADVKTATAKAAKADVLVTEMKKTIGDLKDANAKLRDRVAKVEKKG
jgi:hypothetical protein